jgi:hypothetical protein
MMIISKFDDELKHFSYFFLFILFKQKKIKKNLKIHQQ